jgi:aromatase
MSTQKKMQPLEKQMAGRTDNTVVIRAPLQLAWEMTNDVESWPTLFTEYSAVEILGREGNTVRFRLTMHPDENGKAWSWVSERTIDPVQHTVESRRLETGPFEYMHISWIYSPAGEGKTQMRWIQEFAVKASAPVDDDQAAAHLNQKTRHEMERIKQVVEAESAARSGRPR